jgi:hypothetical protein
MCLHLFRPRRIPTVALGRYRGFREEPILTMVEQLEQGAVRPM